MAFELVYTSVPRGIRPGSSGFCTAAYTNGLAANLIMQLEGMSAYKAYFPHYDANASLNPVAFSHFIFRNSGGRHHILSRVSFYGLDYTKRSNKLAHHIVLSTAEAASVPGGPACVFRQKGLFRTEWQGEPELFQKQLIVSPQDPPLRTADTWKQYTGDAGWAGALADAFLKNPAKPAFVIFDPVQHQNILALVEEALMLLPPERRWQVAFNTYVTTMPAGLQCHWRFCVPDSDPLREARRVPGTLIIDLTRPADAAPDSGFAQIARTGVRPEPVKASVPRTPPPQPAAPPSQPPRQGAPFVPPPIVRRAPDLPPPPPIPKKTRNRSLLWGGVALGGILTVFIGLGVLLYTTGTQDSEPPEIEEQEPRRKQDGAAGSPARGNERPAASKPQENTASKPQEYADLKPLKKAMEKLSGHIAAAKGLSSKKEPEAEKKSLVAARRQLEAEMKKLQPPANYGNAREIQDLLAKAEKYRQEAEEAVRSIDNRLKAAAAAKKMERTVKENRRYFWLEAKNLPTKAGKEWTSPEPLLAEGQSVKNVDIDCDLSGLGSMWTPETTFENGVLTIKASKMDTVTGGEQTMTCLKCRIERADGGKLRFKVEKNENKSVKWKGLTFSDGEKLSFSFVPGKSLFRPDETPVTITGKKGSTLEVGYDLKADKDGLGSRAKRIRFLDAKGKEIVDMTVNDKGKGMLDGECFDEQSLKEAFEKAFNGAQESLKVYSVDDKLKTLKPGREVWEKLIGSDHGYEGMKIKDIKSILKKLKMTELLGIIKEVRSDTYTTSSAVEKPGKDDPYKAKKMEFETKFKDQYKDLKNKVNGYLQADNTKAWIEMSEKGCSGFPYGEIRKMLNAMSNIAQNDEALNDLLRKFEPLEKKHKPKEKYVFVKGAESLAKRLKEKGVRAQVLGGKDGKTLLKEIKEVKVE